MSSQKKLTTDQVPEHLKLFKDSGYDPLAFLTPAQQRFVQIKVLSTTLSSKEIGDMLKVPLSTIKKWEKNPHVLNYAYLCKKEAHDEEFLRKSKQQNKYLADKMFSELASRFDRPNPEAALPPNATENERKRYLDKFASETSFVESAKIFNMLTKQVRADMPENISPVSQYEAEVAKIRENYYKRTVSRNSREEALKSAGLDPNKSLLDNLNATTFDVVNGKAIPVNDGIDDYVEEVYEVEVTKTLRSNRYKSEEDDDYEY